jgi:hypothetical protein
VVIVGGTLPVASVRQLRLGVVDEHGDLPAVLRMTGEMVLFVAAWLAVIVWVGLYLTRHRR